MPRSKLCYLYGSVTLLVFPFAGARAQSSTPARHIHGRVVHAASGTAIGSATVDLTNVATGASAGHVASGSDGSFNFSRLSLGRYRVEVRALGFASKTLPPVTLSAGHPDVDVGTVALTAVAVALQAQSVTAQRDEVQLQPDRTTYVVRDMPTTKGGTALDVLRNVPSVDVDIDNNVSLRGNSGVVVQINGRPSALKGSQLGNFLEQLPADAIDHVEIIPNPSAREDADGVAGIINIVLRQTPDAGTSGGVTVGGGTTGHIDVGANGGLQRGPFSAYGSYSLVRDSRPRYDDIFRQNLFERPLSYLQENGTRTQIPLVHTVTGNATYAPTAHDELSVDGLYSQRREWETQSIAYQTLDTTFAVTDLTDRHSRDVNHEGSADAALNYKHRFAAKGHTLTSELRFEEHFEGGPTDILDQALWPASAPARTMLQQTRTVWTHSSTTSFKADYVRPLNDVLRLETGYKGYLERIRTTQAVQDYDAALSAMLTDTTQTSDFAYDELVQDAYGVLDGHLGRVQFQAGVRAEHAGTTFDLRTRDQRFSNPYNSLFPSGLVSFAVDDADQLKVSYSTRIRRPDDPDLLDPTPHALDALNISVGNPHLRPEYIRAVELGYQRIAERVTVQITPFYRHSFDAVTNIRTVDTTGVTTQTRANIGTTDSYGTDATVALGSGGRLSGFVGGSAYHQKSNAGNLDPLLSASTFGWSVRTNAALHVSRAIDAQALVTYAGRTTVVQGWNAARMRASFGFRDKLMADRLSITTRIIDPFSTSRERSATLDPAFTQINSRLRPSRAVQVSASWMFGRPNRKDDNPIDLAPSGT
ncbi:MAG TPA: TonB-dependent receptor [Gemmatimonadaceae bacterium]|nr:TonB-dependent receptor [Gemmatimonadaceae bacterium]